MNNNKKEALYKKMMETWGEEAQIRMCIEEMSELTKELCKYQRYKDFEKEKVEEVKNHVVEEIADVLNCVEQMRLHFGKDKCDEAQNFKLDRVEKRLNDYIEKNNK